jgi:hypothetical protein
LNLPGSRKNWSQILSIDWKGGAEREGQRSEKGVHEITWGRQVRENPLHLTPYDYI